jgi:glycosyltransferase involved in cell wall biosynthesis
MKVVEINGRFLTQATTGVQRYAAQLLKALDRQLTKDAGLQSRYRLQVITPRTPPPRPFPLHHIPTIATGRLAGHGWEQLELPIHARGRLLLNLCNTAPLLGKTVVAIHDASVFAVPQAYSLAFRSWYRAMLPVLGKRALRVVTVSEFSRGELSRLAGIPTDKVEVIPLGAEHLLETPADTSVLARLPVAPGRYILAVGSRSPHKNLAAAIRAVAQLDSDGLPLIIAGGTNRRIFAGQGGEVGRFHEAGYVTDGELRALYEHAACFVYPSLYEGFGLPPLEAMACGCPTVVSDIASLPEVCGNAAVYCDPRNPADIAARIRMVIQVPARQAELRQRGLARAREFTWDRAARALLDLIARIHPA